MTIIDIIKARKPSPQARGEGIRAAKAFQRSTAALYLDALLDELEQDIDRVLERDALKGWAEDDAARLEQTY